MILEGKMDRTRHTNTDLQLTNVSLSKIPKLLLLVELQNSKQSGIYKVNKIKKQSAILQQIHFVPIRLQFKTSLHG